MAIDFEGSEKRDAFLFLEIFVLVCLILSNRLIKLMHTKIFVRIVLISVVERAY